MTIICIKDGVVVADSASHRKYAKAFGATKKLARSKDGAVGGGSGLTAECFRFQQWIENSATPFERQAGFTLKRPEDTEFNGIWIEPDRTIWRVSHDGIAYTLNETVAAIGSGDDMAMGAMLFGATAREAAELCAAHVAYVSAPFQIETLDPRMPESGIVVDDGLPRVNPAIGSAWREHQGLDVL